MSENIQSYEGRYVIWGPPGTGKTSFLARQVEEIVRRLGGDSDRSPVCVCSLTRTAAGEIASRRMPIPRKQVGTLHAHAYRQLGKPPIAETMILEWNEDKPEYAIDPSAVQNDIDDLAPEPDKRRDDLDGKALYDEYNLLRTKMIPRDQWDAVVTSFAETWEEWKQSNDCIDFTDMIELALRDVGTAPGAPDVIILDECQDLSFLEHSLSQKWAKAAGASMIAGDPYQSIYTWRGSDPSIFMDPSLPKDRRKVLSQSYRVPEKVKTAAMHWISRLSSYEAISYRAREDKDTHKVVEGETRRSPYKYNKPEYLIPEIVESLEADKTVMICASCSYMLKPMLAVLRKEGIPFCNPRRRRRGDWNPLRSTRGVSTSERLLDFLRIDDRTFLRSEPYATQRARLWTAEELESWVTMIRGVKTGVVHRGANKRVARMAFESSGQPLIPEEISTVLTKEGLAGIMDRLGPDTPGQTQTARLVDWLFVHAKAQFERALKFPMEIVNRWDAWKLRDEPKLYIGTIHSFKGFEADHVFVFPDLSPAGLQEWNGAGSDSVVRTFYVAMTRAREIVTFCTPRSMSAVGIADLAS